MEEQLIQMTGLSSSSGCSTSGSSLEQTFQPDCKNSAIEKDGAHAVAPMDVNDPSQHKNSNIIPSICAGLPSSHGFFAPATPSHPEQIGTSSSGGGGHTESLLKEEKEEEEGEELEEEGSFHHCLEEKEPEDRDEGEDTSVDLMRFSEAAAAEAIDDDRRKYPHTVCPSCPECTREFPSWKAVFGHMRSHPKRDWRGIRPAMQKNSVKNYIIFRSPVTGRRSKRPKPRPANPLRLFDLNIEEQETAEFLLMLSDAAITIEEKENNRLIFPSLSSSSSSSLQVPAELIETQSDSIANKEEENPLSHTIISKTDLCQDEKKVSEVMDKDTLRTTKKTASIDKGRYECSTCKKVFASHQALGGHRASHRKLKGCFARTVTNASGEETKEKSEQESEGEPEEEVVRKELNNDFLLHPPAPPPPPPLPPINKGHQCSICLRVFETGQALGGHKRRHWNGERIVKQKKQKKREEKDEQREESEEEEEEKRWLLFDLNLPPPIDEIDQFVLDAAHSKIILNPNNLLPQKAKAKMKKYYCCHLCNETFASREAFCKHQNSHASSSCIPLALTFPPNNLLIPPN